MNKAKMCKLGLSVLGLALTLASSMVNDKIKDAKLEETIAKRVAEALENQVKES